MTVLAAGTDLTVATLTVTRGDGSSYTTRITDSEVATDPLTQAAFVASSLVRVRPELTVAVTDNGAARHQHARRPYLLRLIGQKPCTCLKTYRMITTAYRSDRTGRPLVQNITDP